MTPTPTLRCQALHSSGKRCKRAATRVEYYHGDTAVYCHGTRPTWVRVILCDYHGKDMGRPLRAGEGA